MNNVHTVYRVNVLLQYNHPTYIVLYHTLYGMELRKDFLLSTQEQAQLMMLKAVFDEKAFRHVFPKSHQ